MLINRMNNKDSEGKKEQFQLDYNEYKMSPMNDKPVYIDPSKVAVEEGITENGLKSEIEDFMDYTSTHGIPHIKRVPKIIFKVSCTNLWSTLFFVHVLRG